MAISASEAKEIVLDRITAGDSRADAMKRVGRSVETFRKWMKTDEVFHRRVASIRGSIKEGKANSGAVPDFPEFSARYLRQPLPLHHLRAWDVLNGREPRDLHPSMTYTRGAYGGDFSIFNFPPGHAKSTTWTMNYVVWRIHRNPNIRVVIVSKTANMAQKFLSRIQFVLTSPVFQEMHAAFAPEGGWKPHEKGEGMSWTQSQIYVRGRDAAEKDPTVLTLGVGSQIYGARADLIVLDDIEDYTNSGMYEKHAEWIAQDVFSRLEDDDETFSGQLLIPGTRVAPMDIYKHLRDNAVDADDQPLYTYFAQPAILEGETKRSSEWTVLWPERLNAQRIAKKKGAFTDPRRFQLIYQQDDVPDDAPFPHEAVQAAINRQRYPGLMVPGQTGHRKQGMSGLHIVAGLDPATTGATACVVMGVDKISGKRWILNAFNRRNATPEYTIELIKRVTDEYRVREWRIERNAYQRFLTQLPEVKDYLNTRGVLLREHNTNNNKWDEDWGVETLIPLFLSCVTYDEQGRMIPKADGAGMIEIPKPHNDAISELIRQFQLWEPDMAKSVPTDLVMATWFCECGAKQYLFGSTFTQSHLRGKFVSRRAIQAQQTITMEDLIESGEYQVG